MGSTPIGITKWLFSSVVELRFYMTRKHLSDSSKSYMKYILGIAFLLLVGTTTKTGIASYYHNRFQGRKTASGERYDKHKLTAASNQYKLGDSLRVTNTKNGKSVDIVINDRMSNNGRVIDLSRRAADSLDFIKFGITKVKIELL